MNTLEINTRARYLDKEEKIYYDTQKSPLEGGHVEEDGTIILYKGGYIHGKDDQPAIDCPDGHKEYWKDGNLKKVVSDYGAITEIWKNGELIRTITDEVLSYNEETAYEAF